MECFDDVKFVLKCFFVGLYFDEVEICIIVEFEK